MKTTASLARENKAAAAGAAFLSLVVVAAVFAAWLSPYDPNAQDLAATRQAPSLSHLLGTDAQGSDVLSKLIAGARPTLAVAGAVSVCTVIVGFVLGAVAAYRGGWVDESIMRVVDLMLAFPALLLNIILAAALTRRPGAGAKAALVDPATLSLFLALTLTGWAAVARISRGLVVSIVASQYVTSARALGATGTRIILFHVVPNAATTMVIVLAMRVGATILAAAGLNYLGIGAPSDSNSWGVMVNLGQYDIVTAWWWPLAPATAIALTVLSINLIADAARDVLDPRTQAVARTA
jgi:peptide/nickel transport system permease protein